MPYLHDVFMEYGITRCLVSLLVFSLSSNNASSQDRADVKAVGDQRINVVGRTEVRTLSTVLVGTDDTISIGDFFVSELMTCRVQLACDSTTSPIESVKPSCSCTTAKLSEPITKDGHIIRELLFAVKRDGPGLFHSKVALIHKDGKTRDISLKGDIKPIFEVVPKVFDLNESADSRLIEINCLQDKISLENADVSIGDDRFIVSAVEKSVGAVWFQLAMSPDYKPTQLLSTRELVVNIQAGGRLMTVGLKIKHRPKPVLVPSTLSVDTNSNKPFRLYLLGSKANVLRSTGRARAGIANEKEPSTVGSFKGRSEDSGVFEFERPWNVTAQESSSEMIFEFEISNDRNEKEWVLGGSVVVYFKK